MDYPLNEKQMEVAEGRRDIKRSSMEREMDYVDEARLYLQGYSLGEVANWLTDHRGYALSPSQVSADLDQVTSRWREMYLRDIETLKAQELVRINKLENEYWEAWQRSKSQREKLDVQSTSDAQSFGREGKMRPMYERKKTRKTAEDRDGNVSFLQGIERCIALRMKIFGIGDSKTLNVNWRTEAQAYGVNPESVVNELENQFIEAALAGSGGGRSLGAGTEEPEVD